MLLVQGGPNTTHMHFSLNNSQKIFDPVQWYQILSYQGTALLCRQNPDKFVELDQTMEVLRRKRQVGIFFLGTPCSKPADLKQNLRFYCKTCTLQQNLHYEWKTCRFKTKPVVLLQILQYEWKTCWLSETNILYTGHLFLLQLVSIQLCFVSVVNNVSGIYYSLHPGVAALQCRWVGPVYRTSTQLLQLASNQL